jgi:Flp pilus assembly secretin CpaC
MAKFGVMFGAALLIVVGAADQAALAGSPITIQTDQTQLIAISADPGTVVVGNPSIADVSLSGRRVFLHGRGYGSTNILILDLNGNQLANFDVTVTHDHPNELVVITSSATKPQILMCSRLLPCHGGRRCQSWRYYWRKWCQGRICFRLKIN